MYNELRTVAFQFAPHVSTLEREFFTLDFPEQWKPILLDLQVEASKRQRDQTRIPIKNLNQALRALVPDLISIASNAGRAKIQPWLYSATPISTRVLYLIVQAWVKTSFFGASQESRDRVRQQLHVNDLQWQTKTVDLAKREMHQNGTSKPNSAVFKILPDYLAAELSKPDASIEIHSVPFRFRRCPLAPGGSGAELVSWPPIQDEEPWSIVLRLTVQTVPFQSFPVTYCDCSVRRWMNLPPQYIGARKTSVALLTNVPWLPELPYSNSFQVAPLKWQRIPKAEQQNGQHFRLVWGNRLVDLLNELQLQQPFPNTQEIVEAPETAMNLNSTPNALIYYRTGMRPAHAVEAGLWPGDRQPIAEQLAEQFHPEFIFTEPLQRFKYRRSSKIEQNIFATLKRFSLTEQSLENLKKEGIPDKILGKLKPSKHQGFTTEKTFLRTVEKQIKEGHTVRYKDLILTHAKKNNDNVFKERRKSIGQATGGKLTIEIRHQSSTVHDALLQAICDTLGLQKPENLPYTWETEELTLTLTSELLGEIGDLLEIDTHLKKETDRLHKAIFQRIAQITQVIQTPEEMTGTLVELDNFSDYDNDPKASIRRGFAHTNRITQFITPLPPSKSPKQKKKLLELLSHRATASVLDLLRQLGVQSGKPEIPLEQLPKVLHYAGLWLIKQYVPSSATRTQQFLPVIVYMNSASSDIKVMANGFADWLPYQEALLSIAQGKATGFDKTYKALPFIRKYLQELNRLGDVVVLCHSHNLRGTWKWLQDGKISIDSFTLDKRQPTQPVTQWKHLRIVRIRDSQNHETPEWYGQQGDNVGLPKGLFQINERVFASTADKSGKFKSSPRASKIASYTSAKGKVFDPEPDKPAWNPGLFELTVACKQPDDEAWIWAAVAHELRNMALNYDEATALPLPLHLAKQLKEYTLPLPDEEEE